MRVQIEDCKFLTITDSKNISFNLSKDVDNNLSCEIDFIIKNNKLFTEHKMKNYTGQLLSQCNHGK